MKQNINLLDSLPLQTRRFLTAKQGKIAVAVWLLILMAIYVLEVIAINKNKEILAKLEITKQNLVSETNDLEEQIKNLNTQLNKTNIPQLPPNAVFFYYLQKLAEITPEGVSLANIVFSTPDQSVTLSGKTYSIQLLSDYLNTANKNHALGDQFLNTMKLQKNENDTLSFTVNNLAHTNPEGTK